MPARIQRRRTAGWRLPDGAKYVGRPTRWGNPARLVHADHGLVVQWGTDGGVVGTWADESVARAYATGVYEAWIGQPEQADLLAQARIELGGRDLACWCPLPEPGQPDYCHAAVLLRLVANLPKES